MSATEKPVIFTYADFNLPALCSRASKLRQGIPCICDPAQRPASGSFNWAVFISFEDTVRWVFRSPHSRAFMPMEMGKKLLSSEAATLRYLKAHSDIPVPEIYDYCSSSDNEIGIPFMFMSEAPGRPLSKVWRSAGSAQPDIETSSKAKVLYQLGGLTWKLSQLRFDKIGSLFEEEESFEIKECLSRGHMLHKRYCLEIPRGPFISEGQFYDSLASAFSEQAEILQLSHHCFVAPVPLRDDYDSRTHYESAVDLWNDFVTAGRKIDSSDNRLDYIIAGDALRDIIRKCEQSAFESETFPLCHPDLSVNNIYVDDDYNITCLIDWAFASSVPEAMLLAAPGLPQYRDEISPDIRKHFVDGFLAAIPASTETMIQRYRESLERGKFSWRLGRLLSLDSIADYTLFAAVWHFAYGPHHDMGQYFLQKRRASHYISLYEEVQQEDQPLEKNEKDEGDYFRNKDLRYTIAKKLTLVSEWKTQYIVNQRPSLRSNMFVADSRLWKWIQQCMQDWQDLS
ncbi:hypothetical protein ASPCADRAFT_504297 [Aspergillus carbonarius ITEM 5010]|uniref:Aminoglycoside phosphotransferase domain-containing protein n=1 Tax=Aspergillus carbonarius (strain ITEM 5010) TaxID=602072 RepID=A0A1R3RW34_ASPC5|nr:hypothetical protein ASPCADRAFT_504297 [Aspergillus carbonarius ITEM 5010]